MKVLIIAPHADDEVLGCGGTLAKYKKLGYSLNLVIVGIRELEDLTKYNPVFSIFDKGFNINVQDEHFYKYKREIIKGLEDAYNQIKPDIIFIPNKDDFNNDHKVVHEACEVVCRRFQEHEPKKILAYEVPSSTTQSFNNNFKCNYYETLSEEDLTFKIQLFNIYEPEKRDIPNPRNERGLLIYASFRGMECNSMYAEGFNLIYQKE